MQTLDDAVMEMVFEYLGDEVGFRKALNKAFPGQEHFKELEADRKIAETQLAKWKSKRKKLLDKVADELISDEELVEAMPEIREKIDLYEAELKVLGNKLSKLPEAEVIKAEAEEICSQLLQKYHSIEHMKEMSFDEKRALLEYFFGAEDSGIFVEPTERGKLSVYLNGRFWYGNMLVGKTAKPEVLWPTSMKKRNRKPKENKKIDSRYLSKVDLSKGEHRNG
jgi:hypothetical protein